MKRSGTRQKIRFVPAALALTMAAVASSAASAQDRVASVLGILAAGDDREEVLNAWDGEVEESGSETDLTGPLDFITEAFRTVSSQTLSLPCTDGRVSSGFGYRPAFGRMHKGIDIAVRTGMPVFSVAPGCVRRTGEQAHGYGKYVVVVHDDGLETRYAHLSRILVKEGDRVETYRAIALSGNSGNSTGPHLHFETRYMGKAVDPSAIIDMSPYMKDPGNDSVKPSIAGNKRPNK